MNRCLENIISEIEKVIAGKRPVIMKILMAVLAGGHILLDDVPGVGKTTLAMALGKAADLDFRRIQFTPDVLPSDIVGFSMYNKETGKFEYRQGAVNDANLVLGDEINRASSRTQSALLEAMEEGRVTVDGNTYSLPDPFVVIASQNRVGAAGTQPLPYAQMDRFMIRLSVGYPDYDAQMGMLKDRQDSDPMGKVCCVVSRHDLLDMKKSVESVTVKDLVLDYIIRLSQMTRENKDIRLGISPRGSLLLCRMAKARAYFEGRDYVTGTDVQAVFKDVCAHRIILKQDELQQYDSHSNTMAEEILDQILKSADTPDARSIQC